MEDGERGVSATVTFTSRGGAWSWGHAASTVPHEHHNPPTPTRPPPMLPPSTLNVYWRPETDRSASAVQRQAPLCNQRPTRGNVALFSARST